MNSKDINVGEYYVLASNKKSREGCSKEYFKKLWNVKVMVVKKLNNFNNRNTIYIQGLVETNGSFNLVSFWCSPYDLKKAH